MCIYLLLFFGVWVRPFLFQNIYIVVFLMCFTFIASIGGFWIIYQAVRYEKRVGKYVLLSFIPFMFVWYSLVRLPLRREFQGKSDFIR